MTENSGITDDTGKSGEHPKTQEATKGLSPAEVFKAMDNQVTLLERVAKEYLSILKQSYANTYHMANTAKLKMDTGMVAVHERQMATLQQKVGIVEGLVTAPVTQLMRAETLALLEKHGWCLTPDGVKEREQENQSS